MILHESAVRMTPDDATPVSNAVMVISDSRGCCSKCGPDTVLVACSGGDFYFTVEDPHLRTHSSAVLTADNLREIMQAITLVLQMADPAVTRTQ